MKVILFRIAQSWHQAPAIFRELNGSVTYTPCQPRSQFQMGLVTKSLGMFVLCMG